MKKPNFFIIGAPKCGTTSLASWLSEHPNVYMSPKKEPHYFCTDLKYVLTRTSQMYESLFYSATADHRAIGEASVFYLFSEVAVPRIERELPKARYIVMLRNPVDMAYSLHQQQLVAGNEHISDFAEAWSLSNNRARGQAVKGFCRDPILLDYKSLCSLGEQLQRLLRVVPKQRVLVLLLDDIRRNPRAEYLRVLDFLGVQDDGRVDFPVKNQAKKLRWPPLLRATQFIGRGAISCKKVLGIPVNKGMGLTRALTTLNALNIRERPRPEMSTALRAELSDYFREDVLLLAHLLERDMSSWLSELNESRETISRDIAS